MKTNYSFVIFFAFWSINYTRLSAEDFYNCNGTYKSSACGMPSQPHGKTLQIVSLPVSPKEQVAETRPKRLVTFRTLPRQEPQLSDVISQPLSRFVHEYHGTVKGAGDIELKIFFIPRNLSGNLDDSRKKQGQVRIALKDRNCLTLPNEGGSCNFIFQCDVPTNDKGFDYQILAVNKGVIVVPELQGCCSWHDGVGKCLPSGAVLCDDGKVSPTCLCR